MTSRKLQILGLCLWKCSVLDVTMGSFDGAEVCELISLFLLNNLSEKYGKNNVGLYRDDGLILLRNASGPQSERTRKDIT